MRLLKLPIVGKEKETVLVQLFYLFIAPPLLLYLHVIPSEWRMVVLISVSLVIAGIIAHEKWGKQRLGIRPMTKGDLAFYLGVTLAGIIVLRLLAELFGFAPVTAGWWRHTQLLVFFIPVSFLQEFAFRGVLVPLSFQLFSDTRAVILLNVLLFAFIHIIYPPLAVSIPVAIFAGFAFTLAYLRHPNIILISLCHAVLNFVAVGHGFFNI